MRAWCGVRNTANDPLANGIYVYEKKLHYIIIYLVGILNLNVLLSYTGIFGKKNAVVVVVIVVVVVV